MSDFDSNPDGLDRWLANQRRELIVDLAATLDVEAGLGDALTHPRHADLVAGLGRSLDVEAGLAAIVPPTTGVMPPNKSATSSSLRAGPKQVAATGPARAKVGTGTARNPRRVRDRVIAAVVVVIALAGLTATAIWRTLTSSPPTTAAPALVVLDYGVTAPSQVGTCDPKTPMRFTFTVRARGSGTVDYTWKPDDGLSNQPYVRKTMTFTGVEQTMQDVYTVPRLDGQRRQGGVTVVITEQGSYLGATYITCDGSSGNGSNGGL